MYKDKQEMYYALTKMIKLPDTYTKINHALIYSNVKLGENFKCGPFSVIGKDGFSMVEIEGIPKLIPHIGGVAIGDNVEIGSNCCIDKGTLENTIIGNNVKIDNLVHISHNCKIGNNVVIGAGAVIGGSCVIEDGSVVHIGQTIPSHTTIQNTDKNVCDTVSEVKTKLIITDLDNTLWDGVVGEDGWENVKIHGKYLELQTRLKELSSKGILLAICSKNTEEIAFDCIEKNPNMILRKEDFITWRINWAAKSDNIKEMLEELNLSENGVIYIDDSAHQRDLISNILPGIEVITEEDTKRLVLYKTEQTRQTFKKKFKSNQEWVDSLELNIDIHLYEDKYFDRCFQLFNKTNQMNLSSKRMTEEEFKQHIKNNIVWIVFVSDKFGEYGLTGIIVFNNGRLLDLILSCRILGRQIEQQILSYVELYCSNNKIDSLSAKFNKTKYNLPMEEFLNENFDKLDEENYLREVNDGR